MKQARKEKREIPAELIQKACQIPRCFDHAQWSSWKKACSRGRVFPNQKDTYCEDCTPDYKREMMKADKCDWPDVKFIVDADGFTYGYRPSMRLSNIDEHGDVLRDGEEVV